MCACVVCHLRVCAESCLHDFGGFVCVNFSFSPFFLPYVLAAVCFSAFLLCFNDVAVLFPPL